MLRSLAVALTLTTCAWPSIACAQSAEDKLKAAFIYNFAKFVTWPAVVFDSRPNIVVCAIGTNAINGALIAIENRSAQGKPLKVLPDARPSGIASCDIVYVPQSEKGRLETIIQSIRGSPALFVSDINGFADEGGMIELSQEEKRISFDVNLDETDRAGLKINPQLLRVARSVRKPRKS